MSREQFEAWERSRRMPPEWLERNSRGEYHVVVEAAWQAWQSAYQAGLERAAEICDCEAENLMDTGSPEEAAGARHCQSKIEGAASLHAASRQPDSADATG